ncbi:solute carrier organic anion transporter family member 5A1-like [Physella acuta]|uniref:solute carrier organic anion transporter family member 5A1-like n=1 Tax=Physella acuta TaxID=109671 RepID=UPI0027DCBD53|nr:solute carrier organic anion transporter family member 5A1-like [Physella acuta]
MEHQNNTEFVSMLPSPAYSDTPERYVSSKDTRHRVFPNSSGDSRDDAEYFESPSDLESPGNISQGQVSLGVVSTISGQSDHSRTALLKKDQKEVVVEQRMGMFEDDEEANQCRLGSFSPQCFQACANVKMFVFFMCVLRIVSSALAAGYLNSVITTIEKRFEIGSSISGLIATANHFGNLVAVIFVSYLGASRHIPKWIGLGVLIMGTGSLLFSLPHILAPKYTVNSGMSENQTEDANICRAPGVQAYDSGLCIRENSGNWGYVLVLVAAQIMIGTGGTPIMTLGVTYVDNHVAKEKSPAYLACIHASGVLGPVLGYALGALLLQYYVDTFSHDVLITTSSPRWIGAWWGGFIICGVLLLLLSLPFLAYPRVLVRERRKVLETKTKEALLQKADDDDIKASQYGRSIKEIPKAVLHLLKNPVYAVMLPAICCEICIVSGFVVFLPKYLESQFGTSPSLANLYTGGIGIPGAVIGILIGGYILKRLALSPKGAIQFVLLLNTLALCGFSFFFFMGCDNPKIAGANFPYLNSSDHKIFEVNLTSTCNQNCDCLSNHYQPICGINGITYFSPCHAGCTGSNHFYDPGREEKSYNYSGCSCISLGPADHSNHEVIISPMATSGACKNTCERLLPFLILLVGMTFCVASTQMPLLMVTLRSVATMERSFALGLQFVMMRLFAYIPSPIFFGNAIDTSCLLWSVKCERNGSCLLYDIVRFRYKYVGIAAGLKVISMCFFVGVWYFIRKRTIAENAVTMVKTSHISVDKTDHKNGTLDEAGKLTPRPSILKIKSPASPSRQGANKPHGQPHQNGSPSDNGAVATVDAGNLTDIRVSDSVNPNIPLKESIL